MADFILFLVDRQKYSAVINSLRRNLILTKMDNKIDTSVFDVFMTVGFKHALQWL